MAGAHHAVAAGKGYRLRGNVDFRFRRRAERAHEDEPHQHFERRSARDRSVLREDNHVHLIVEASEKDAPNTRASSESHKPATTPPDVCEIRPRDLDKS